MYTSLCLVYAFAFVALTDTRADTAQTLSQACIFIISFLSRTRACIPLHTPNLCECEHTHTHKLAHSHTRAAGTHVDHTMMRARIRTVYVRTDVHNAIA